MIFTSKTHEGPGTGPWWTSWRTVLRRSRPYGRPDCCPVETACVAFIPRMLTKPPIALQPSWWQRSWRWWGSSWWTPWPRPAGGWYRGLRLWWRLAAIFFNKWINYTLMNITCKIGFNMLKTDSFIAFLLKNCKRGQITDHTLYIHKFISECI